MTSNTSTRSPLRELNKNLTPSKLNFHSNTISPQKPTEILNQDVLLESPSNRIHHKLILKKQSLTQTQSPNIIIDKENAQINKNILKLMKSNKKSIKKNTKVNKSSSNKKHTNSKSLISSKIKANLDSNNLNSHAKLNTNNTDINTNTDNLPTVNSETTALSLKPAFKLNSKNIPVKNKTLGTGLVKSNSLSTIQASKTPLNSVLHRSNSTPCSISKDDFRQYAERLKMRLKLAHYKMKTNQVSVPFDSLSFIDLNPFRNKHKNLPSSKPPIKPLSKPITKPYSYASFPPPPPSTSIARPPPFNMNRQKNNSSSFYIQSGRFPLPSSNFTPNICSPNEENEGKSYFNANDKLGFVTPHKQTKIRQGSLNAISSSPLKPLLSSAVKGTPISLGAAKSLLNLRKQ